MLLYIQWETAEFTWQCPPTAHHPWQEVKAPALVVQQGYALASIALGLLGCPQSGSAQHWMALLCQGVLSVLSSLETPLTPMASSAKIKGNSTAISCWLPIGKACWDKKL